MKKFLFALMALSFASLNYAQLPYVESFETDGLGSRYTADADVYADANDYFHRTDGTGGMEANINNGYSGQEGSYFWSGEDHDASGVGGGGNPSLCITISNIDVSSNTGGNFEIGALFAANQISNAYDAGTADGISLSYSVNGGAYQTALLFSYYTPNGGLSEYLALDDNKDGTVSLAEGSSTILTRNLERYTTTFSAPGATTINIQICAYSNASSEEWAVDAIEISSVLPVELINFDALAIDDGIRLDWATASETNNDFFSIERSIDGRAFKEIAQVQGRGTSYTQGDYQFIDEAPPLSATLYYRLRQFDFDGQYHFSPITVIDQPLNRNELSIIPNPATEQVMLQLGERPQQALAVKIYDAYGTLVQQLQLDKSNIQYLDVSHLMAGNYVIHLSDGVQHWVQQLVMIKM
ncbi:MAG: T9SS type A sorting domain-containing protein [Bacteroidota bacterium]